MFSYIVLNNEGTPVFQYPKSTQTEIISSNKHLYTALLGAIRTCCGGQFDNDIKDFIFGNIRTTISRDKEHNLHVLLTNSSIGIEKNRELHLAMKTLFLTSLNKIGANLKFENVPTGELLEKIFRSAFEPLKIKWETEALLD